MPVTFILGGAAYVSRADWATGAHSLRAYTKAGKPRTRRARYRGEETPPLLVGRRLTIESIGEAR